MFRRGWIVFRILGAVLAVILILVAVVLAYQAGVSQGASQAATLAQNSGSQPVPGYPFYPWFWGPRFGFFPFFPLFGCFFVGLLFLFALRLLFRPWHWGYSGRWHGHPRDWGSPPWAKESPERKSEPEAEAGDAEKPQG